MPSPSNARVINSIEAADDFLFLWRDSNNLIDQITQKNDLPEPLIQHWQNALSFRTSFCATEVNAAYYLFIVPNKHCVYPEHLPADVTISKKRIACQLAALSPKVFYPVQSLRQHAKDNLQYFKTDTHWNSLGCMNAWNDFSKLAHLGVQIDTESIRDANRLGDLGRQYDPPRRSVSPTITYSPQSKIVWSNELENRGTISVFQNSAPNAAGLKRCLLFGDSFSRMFLSHIADYFSTLVFVHSPAFCEELVRRIQPDVVITCNVERFIKTPGPRCRSVTDTIFMDFFETLKYPIENLQSFSRIPAFDMVCTNTFRRMQKTADTCLKLYPADGNMIQMRQLIEGKSSQITEQRMKRYIKTSQAAHVYYGAFQFYKKKNDWRLAHWAIKNAIKRYPESARYWHSLADHLMDNKKYRRAIRAVKKAIRYQPHCERHRNLLGKIFLSQQKPRRAINPLKQSLDINIAEPHTHFLLSSAFLQLECAQLALQHAKIACELSPGDNVCQKQLAAVQAHPEVRVTSSKIVSSQSDPGF